MDVLDESSQVTLLSLTNRDLPVLGRKGLFWGLGEHAGSQTPFPPPTPAMAGPDILGDAETAR